MRVFFAAVLFLASTSLSAQERGWCATPSPPPGSESWFRAMSQLAQQTPIPKSTVRIPIAFHVVHDGRNGRVSLQQIAILIDNLNWAFRETPFSFYLYKADSLKNKGWYNNCVLNRTNMQKLRKRMAKDVRYYVNVYSCNLGAPNLYGMATFPPGYPDSGNVGNTYLQGVAVAPIALGSNQFPYGLALAHEVGHYLGLLHTFETALNEGGQACAEPGDLVTDTPAQDGDTFGECPIGRDSCPGSPGNDDIPNLMNYATDECWDHFTVGQTELILYALANFRPTLGSR